MVMTDVLSERSPYFVSKNALISFFGKSKIVAIVRNANVLLLLLLCLHNIRRVARVHFRAQCVSQSEKKHCLCNKHGGILCCTLFHHGKTLC